MKTTFGKRNLSESRTNVKHASTACKLLSWPAQLADGSSQSHHLSTDAHTGNNKFIRQSWLIFVNGFTDTIATAPYICGHCWIRFYCIYICMYIVYMTMRRGQVIHLRCYWSQDNGSVGRLCPLLKKLYLQGTPSSGTSPSLKCPIYLMNMMTKMQKVGARDVKFSPCIVLGNTHNIVKARHQLEHLFERFLLSNTSALFISTPARKLKISHRDNQLAT